jgi:hypothetical protein
MADVDARDQLVGPKVIGHGRALVKSVPTADGLAARYLNFTPQRGRVAAALIYAWLIALAHGFDGHLLFEDALGMLR